MRGPTSQFIGYEDHHRSVRDVVDIQEWNEHERWCINESLGYARMVSCPKNVTGARVYGCRPFVDIFESMLNDWLHEPLNICTATVVVQNTEQASLTDGGFASGENRCDLK